MAYNKYIEYMYVLYISQNNIKKYKKNETIYIKQIYIKLREI